MSRLTDFRNNFAGLCAKADRKLETQHREARKLSALHGHNTLPLKLRNSRQRRAPLTDLSTPTNTTHEN